MAVLEQCHELQRNLMSFAMLGILHIRRFQDFRITIMIHTHDKICVWYLNRAIQHKGFHYTHIISMMVRMRKGLLFHITSYSTPNMKLNN